jgi:hypothetical protein
LKERQYYKLEADYRQGKRLSQDLWLEVLWMPL